ncbi:MAG: flagellar hook assembly protein FlgD [Hyphococcus sp.]
MIDGISTAAENAAKAAAAGDSSEANSAAATAASDFESFLMLLTAQMRNQDPLAPIDSTQFVEQLASFSSVEQQIATNAKLDALTSALAVSDLTAATQWVGKDVEVVSPVAAFSGEPVAFRAPESGVSGATVEFVVNDPNGNPVYAERLPLGTREFVWDGKTANGANAPEGTYSVSVNYISEGDVVETRAPIATARVNEARTGGDGLSLVLGNGAAVTPEDVIAVKAPSPTNDV